MSDSEAALASGAGGAKPSEAVDAGDDPEADEPGADDQADEADEPSAEGPGDSQASPEQAVQAGGTEDAETGEPAESGEDSAPDPAAERDQYLEDLQRVTAEFANFRRQASKRAAEVSAQAGARLAEALLVVFDACEAASRQGVEGVDEIAGQLTAVLTREGLEVIRDDGKPFDPARHEATLSEPADPDDEDPGGPVVTETLRTGYAWNGRVLRAAMVRVKG